MHTPIARPAGALTVRDAFDPTELRQAQWHASQCRECERNLWRDLTCRIDFDQFLTVARILWHRQELVDRMRDQAKTPQEDHDEPF